MLCFSYDPLNRLETTTVKSGSTELYTTTYEYGVAQIPEGEEPDANRTSNEVLSQYTQLANGTVVAGGRYAYDELGNITTVYESHLSQEGRNRRPISQYTYDAQSQLTSETHYTYIGNGVSSYNAVSWYYTYDTAGNILSQYKILASKNGANSNEICSEAMDIKSYTYSTGEWKDLLTAVTLGNTTHSLTYDAIGNPLTYGNGQQLYTNLTWEHGRQLVSLTTNGDTYTYDYDADGIRTQKVGNGEQHDYITQNGKVVRETVQSADWDWVLDFIYDNAGRPFALNFSTDGGATFTTYYYVLNLQGDVVALLNASGTVVARYTYNAWGELLSVTTDNGTAIANTLDIAHLNPLRYRGYYYDTETGLYYVSSRYYDPEIGRWINADSVVAGVGGSLQGYNMFAYCFNNPVNMSDSSGHWPQWIKDAANWVDDNIIRPVVNFVKDVAEDIKNYDWNNQSEEKVLESNYFSSYKGVLVIRTNGDRSGSFGAIFLTRETNNRSNPEDVLRHEYGHTKQLEQLGLLNYALCIGLPSWQQWGTGEYYSKPWEVTADIYGGVQSRNHSQSDIDRGFAYLEGSKIIGPFIWMFIE